MIMFCMCVRLERRTHLLSRAFNFLVRTKDHLWIGQRGNNNVLINNVLVKEGVIVYSGVEDTLSLSFVL